MPILAAAGMTIQRRTRTVGSIAVRQSLIGQEEQLRIPALGDGSEDDFAPAGIGTARRGD